MLGDILMTVGPTEVPQTVFVFDSHLLTAHSHTGSLTATEKSDLTLKEAFYVHFFLLSKVPPSVLLLNSFQRLVNTFGKAVFFDRMHKPTSIHSVTHLNDGVSA